MTHIQQNIGKHAQRTAESYLSGLGFLMVEKIGTPVILTPATRNPYSSRRNTYHVTWGEKVSGDGRALLPNGLSVLFEVKHTSKSGENLAWSQLEDHQRNALSTHAGIGEALSLLVWVSDSVYVMRWMPEGIKGFAPRKSITAQMAEREDEKCMRYLERFGVGRYAR